MKRRSFLWSSMAALAGLLFIRGARRRLAARELGDDLLLVDGWIVRREQLPKEIPDAKR